MAELEQTLIRSDRHLLAMQLGWFRETAKRYNYNPPGSAAGPGVASSLAVDANEKLLDGTPNPFFGRRYIGIAEPLSVRDHYQNDTYRMQLAHRLDFSREQNWKSWLGMHELVGYYEYKQAVKRVFRYRDVIAENHAWLAAGNPRGNQGTNPGVAPARTYPRYYLGDNVGPNVDYAATDYRHGTYPFT